MKPAKLSQSDLQFQVSALKKEVVRLQRENAKLKVENFSLKKAVAALEKETGAPIAKAFREMLARIDGSKHEKI